jgi:hypothetical protein
LNSRSLHHDGGHISMRQASIVPDLRRRVHWVIVNVDSVRKFGYDLNNLKMSRSRLRLLSVKTSFHRAMCTSNERDFPINVEFLTCSRCKASGDMNMSTSRRKRPLKNHSWLRESYRSPPDDFEFSRLPTLSGY